MLSVILSELLPRGKILRNFWPTYLVASDTEANRWQQQYVDSLLQEEVLTFADIQNIRTFETVVDLLRTRVGYTISYQSIALDLGISPNTVKKYIQILEALYIIFRVTPYSKNIARSLIKEPKIYFFDTGLVKGDDGAKFENLVAVCLLKHIYSKIDYLGEEYALHYIRTKDKEEVDFAIIKDKKIQLLIEAKNSDDVLSKTLKKFHEKYQLPAMQVVKLLRQTKQIDKIKICPAHLFLQELDL